MVITGLGVVAPNGIGKDAFWQNLIAGHSAVDWITAFDPSPYPCKVAAEVKDFRATDFMPSRVARTLSRCTQLAVTAAQLAAKDASLASSVNGARDRVGVCFGTSASGIGDIGEDNHRKFLSGDALNLNPLAMLEYPAHASTSHIAQSLFISGPCTTIASGCSTGLDTVLWGKTEIADGRLDIAVVGASEAPVTEFIFSLFCAGNFLSTWHGTPSQASRPYDLLRSGLVLAEGAAALILEDRDHALDRGVRIYADLTGAGSSTEGGFNGNIKSVYRRSLERAIRACLQSAEISPHDLDHINAHGNSTRNDDAAETNAYKHLLGAYAYRIPIMSIKGAVGQPLAAGGVLQMVTACLGLQEQVIPPTVNQRVRDPECDLDYVPNVSRVARIRNVLVHSHSLGGLVPGSHTAVLVSLPVA